jgi:hypothetical protein
MRPASAEAVASAVARRLGLRPGQGVASAVAPRLRQTARRRRFPVNAVASAIAARLAPLSKESEASLPVHDEAADQVGVPADNS